MRDSARNDAKGKDSRKETAGRERLPMSHAVKSIGGQSFRKLRCALGQTGPALGNETVDLLQVIERERPVRQRL